MAKLNTTETVNSIVAKLSPIETVDSILDSIEDERNGDVVPETNYGYVSVMAVERPSKKEEHSFFDLLLSSAVYR